MRHAYQAFRFSDATLGIIARATMFIKEYQKQGYMLTLRQLYYRFIATDAFPESWRDTKTGSKNVEKSYKHLGSIINDARLGGLIDWTAIEDRTRTLMGLTHWNSPSDIVRACADQYRIDTWEDQGKYVEVWVEKDALESVVGRAANACDVKYFSCRGYTSQSAMWEAGQRLMRAAKAGRKCIVLHMGDHDPSGLDMTSDIRSRLRMFMEDQSPNFHLERIALTMDQVKQYNPPPSPAKVTDSRYQAYMEEYGDDSWELDSLEPKILDDLIQEKVIEHCDSDLRKEKIAKSEKQRNQLQIISDRWDEIIRIAEEE